MKKIFFSLFVTSYFLVVSAVYSQGFNVASTYEISDKDAVSGDILISDGEKGLIRTDVTYSPKIFGILEDNPVLVLKEATSSAKPIIRAGDTIINVTDFNGDIKKGDFITTSPVLGKGMKAGQSGYVLGIALEDAQYGSETASTVSKQTKLGRVKIAIRIEFAELSTARSNFALLNQLNTAFFRSVQDPEKFTLTIRYIIAGFIALVAFGVGFFWVSRSISKAVEALGRNPLAKNAIIASVGFQVVATLIGALATLGIIFVIVRI